VAGWRPLRAWIEDGLAAGDLERAVQIRRDMTRRRGLVWLHPDAQQRLADRIAWFRTEWAAGRLTARGLLGQATRATSLDFLAPDERLRVWISAWRSELHYVRPGRPIDVFAVEAEATQPQQSAPALRLDLARQVWAEAGRPPGMDAKEAYRRAIAMAPHNAMVCGADRTWRRAWSQALAAGGFGESEPEP
jgi:hypothetical protein